MSEPTNTPEEQNNRIGNKVSHLPNVMRSFSLEDLRKAFEAGQEQARAEWDNDTTSTIGYYNSCADDTFESWLSENCA